VHSAQAELAERVDHEAAADRDAAHEDREIHEAGGAAGQERAPVHSREPPKAPFLTRMGVEWPAARRAP